MSTSGHSGGSGLFDPSGPLVGQAINVLPPEIQALVKPGPSKTSDRIQHALAWAARNDPTVVRLHHARNSKVKTFEDIHDVPLAQKDAVAREIARSYRRRAMLTGAITGLPGGLWALVAAGADVQLTAIYAVRMAAMVAQSYGYDTGTLEEQAHLADVLALVAGVDSLRGVGNYLTREGLIHMMPEVLPKLLTRISVQITKEQTAKWAGRIVPGVGAVVGGAIDYGFLRAAGNNAIKYYHERFLAEHDLLPGGGLPAQLPPGVVEGSVASSAPVAGAPSMPPMASAANMSAAAPVAVPARQATPAPLPAKHRHPPERFATRLALFAFFALGITILACAALTVLVVQWVSGGGIHF